MSSNVEAFALKEDDAMKLLVCESHIGANSCDHQMEHYIWKRRNDGTFIINLRKTWEKLLFAARAIAAVENPADVCVISARPYAQRALLKYAAHTGATPIFGRFTPGSLTNQIQKNFKEPRLLVISDPKIDHQAVTEASYVNIPVISFCNTDSPLKFIDVAIPCNNKGQHSVGLLWWLLAREVLLLRGKITRQIGFVLDDKLIMPDLYFYRDPQEQEKEAEEARDKEPWTEAQMEAPRPDEFPITAAASADPVKLDFQVPHIEDWAAASTWEQPAAAPAAPAVQEQQTAAADEWGATGGGGW
jgi:small subunit ribosomal protein SAe